MTFVQQWNEAENPEMLNLNTQLEQAAPIILEAIKNLEEQYYTWKNPLEIPDLYPGNAQAVKEAMIQQAIWQFTAALQGKPYTFQQFEESIVKQDKVKAWLNTNGTESILIDYQTLQNKTYFNYQCQKLWSMITDLNFYINSSSRKLIPNWERNTGKIQVKYIEFIELWESIDLTGDYFKSEKSTKAAPVAPKQKSDKKKIVPYVAGGVGAVGLVTGVILLKKKPGCTNPSACNYDEQAKKDDGTCLFDDCKGACGGSTTMGSSCNDGDDTTINDAYNFACECVGTILVPGCTNSCASNFNPEANEDDGSCTVTEGCTNPTACNYDENACEDDGTCDLGNQACDDPCSEPDVDDGCNLTNDTFDAETCTVINTPDCPSNTIFNANTCNCDTEIIEGCMDKCAPNFDENANIDGENCEDYDKTCNTDCTMGDIEVWDAINCECMVSVETVSGCRNSNACNYNPDANCGDGNCDLGNTNCDDPCNEPDKDDGCNLTTDTFNAATCTVTNTPNCPTNTTFNANNCTCVSNVIKGCTDRCAPNFNPNADEDDGTCQSYNTTCNSNCLNGAFGGTWDVSICKCVNQTTPIKGCTNSSACNYKPNANCDDGSCDLPPCNPGCTDPCAPNYDSNADEDDGTCQSYNTTCNSNCLNGAFGGTWGASTCKCVDEIAPIRGCTNSSACNYKSNANCDDGSCSTLIGTSCDDGDSNTFNDAIDVNCECKGRVPNCSLNKGVVKFDECGVSGIDNCRPRSYYLIKNDNGMLLDPTFNSVGNCFFGYEGQTVYFDYEILKPDEIGSNFTCTEIATPIRLTCLETFGNCKERVTIVVDECSCDGSNDRAFLETGAGKLLEFRLTRDCSGNTFTSGDM